jgi:hypothetical protein
MKGFIQKEVFVKPKVTNNISQIVNTIYNAYAVTSTANGITRAVRIYKTAMENRLKVLFKISKEQESIISETPLDIIELVTRKYCGTEQVGTITTSKMVKTSCNFIYDTEKKISELVNQLEVFEHSSDNLIKSREVVL